LAVRRLAGVVAGVAVVATGASAASPPEVERLPTTKRVIALTFDGGDNAGGVPLIMRTLRRRRAAATFFVTGAWVRRFPRYARAIGRRYPVGNHTFDHADQTHLSAADVRREITRARWWIRAGTGRDPKPLFRFPYGARDERTLAIVHELGYESIRWSLDTWGWMGPSEGQSVDSVVRRFESGLEPGAIVLMHLGVARDGSLLDAQALDRVITIARRRGYRLVTLGRWIR
jgi:peptidoglycan/xylan/chitin deacetylase (PgdA/CDA1 family)